MYKKIKQTNKKQTNKQTKTKQNKNKAKQELIIIIFSFLFFFLFLCVSLEQKKTQNTYHLKSLKKRTKKRGKNNYSQSPLL